MGEVKGILKRVKEKKWGKEEWIILILSGVFLLIVFWPNSKSDNKDNAESTNKSILHTDSQSVVETTDNSYKTKMETQLEEVLKSIDGIDSANVMLTLQTTEEDVILKEIKNTKEITLENDSQGGTREIESDSVEETVCYSDISGEMSEPYVTYTKLPKVEGVLIVVGGESAGTLRTQIVKAVQALFDVESHKVVVIKK